MRAGPVCCQYTCGKRVGNPIIFEIITPMLRIRRSGHHGQVTGQRCTPCLALGGNDTKGIKGCAINECTTVSCITTSYQNATTKKESSVMVVIIVLYKNGAKKKEHFLFSFLHSNSYLSTPSTVPQIHY